MKKRLLSLMISVLMIVTALPAVAVHAGLDPALEARADAAPTRPADGTDDYLYYGDFRYELCEDGGVWVWYLGSAETVVVPGMINGYTVTRIAPYAFQFNTTVTKVVLPDSVLEIGFNAFDGCSNLRSVDFGEGLKYIGSAAFRDCLRLKDVTFPDGLLMIGSQAFCDCVSLEAVSFPEGLLNIGNFAFYGDYSLSAITLPDSLTHIGVYAFDGTAYVNLAAHWRQGFLYIGHHLIKVEKDKSGPVSVKDGTLLIASRAFYKCSMITSVSFPDSLRIVGMEAFQECSGLTGTLTLSVPGLTVESQCFYKCTNITSLVVEEGVKSIEYHAFQDCSSLASVTLPDKIDEIGGNPFFGTAYYNDQSHWSGKAFYVGKHLIEVKNDISGGFTVPDGTLSIAGLAFRNSENLTVVTIPGSVRAIGERAFEGCTNSGFVISCYGGSYAHRYAVENDLPYRLNGVASSIQIATAPDKISYRIGEELDITGLTVRVMNSAGVNFIVDSGFTVDPYDFSIEGEKNIIVRYMGLSTSFKVYVSDEPNGYPESDHPYASNTDKTWNYTYPEDAEYLEINFSDLCELEAGYDFVYVFDGENNRVGRYTGKQLAGLTVIVPGNSFSIRLTSDSASEYYGFSITNVYEHEHDYMVTSYQHPTCTAAGYYLYTCDCGDQYIENVPALGHYWGEWVVDVEPTLETGGHKHRVCAVCGTREDKDMSPWQNPFSDVKETAWYYKAVMWAYYHDPQIVSGTTADTFSPKNPCTRAQVVTFLWHAMGDPKAASDYNPFSDVKEGEYYYKAVLWAIENDITSGIGNGLFGINEPCKREQVVTFLWKTVGSPEPKTTENPFSDVKEGKYYYKAVLWAVENGITSGMSDGRFGVGETCTRAHIVTFLYAAFGK